MSGSDLAHTTFIRKVNIMNDLVKEQLIRIVRENGEEVLLDPVRTKAFLNDLCGNKYKREINSITLALKEGAAAELLNSRRNRTERFAIARLSKNLEESFGFPNQQTIWALESIAIALGITIQDEPIDSVEKAEEKAPETKPLDLSKSQVSRKEETKDEKKESVYTTPANTRKVGKKRRIGLRLFGIFALITLMLVFILISLISRNKSPMIPTNPSPSDEATNQPLAVTLSWDCSDPDGDSLTYVVYFGTSSNPPKASTDQSEKSLNRTNLLYGTTYYWKVVAKDSKGTTTEGPVWRFTTSKENRAPIIQSNPSPSDKATNQPLAVTLSWECNDPDGDSLTYDVYFGTSSNPPKVSANQSGKTLNRSNLSAETTYYWKVTAKDSNGATTETPIWSFSTHIDLTLYTPSSIVPPTVLVEKGSFTMGDNDEASNEKPTHKVTFTYDFYMGKYETTFDEYDAFRSATGENKPKDQHWGRGTRPVINVSWKDAIAYCNWLSDKEKLPKTYDSNGNLLDKDGRVTIDPSKVVGYRLPTEAEWEYAARGGNKSKGYKYSGSDNVSDVTWYKDNSGSKTQEVGKKAPNELGIYDMSGNVWEWCSDWYGDYSSSAQTNPYSNSGSSRVLRGGSWNDYAAFTRVANRSSASPTFTDYALGFRICRTVPYEGENRPPLAPYNPIPSNGSIAGATSVTLSWDSYDPDDDTMTYDVYFGTSSNPPKVSANQSGKTLNRSNLSAETTYYWKVTAKDSNGATTERPIWSFSTHIDLILYTPSTVVPQMILVEKGSFTMGDTWGYGYYNEKPTPKVTLTYNFYIGKYEVTFDKYDAFCEATDRSKPDDSGWGRGTRPVINVTWWDAIDYCNWLNEKEKLPKAYDSKGNLLDKDGRVTTDPSKVVGYRLPTEAEWEYAARGGNKSKGYKYSGSDNVSDVAWYSGSKTQEVGKKAPNELGIYDMSGNVYEWCSDWYDSYSFWAKTNPYNNSGSDRVLRGGSWYNVAANVRVAYRDSVSPTYTNYSLGFRICRTVP